MQTHTNTVAGACDLIADRQAEIAQITAELKKLPQNEFIDLERQNVALVAHQLQQHRDLLNDTLARARKRTEKTVPQRMADTLVVKALQHGGCDPQHLIDEGFTPQEVIEYGEEAKQIARARVRSTPQYHADWAPATTERDSATADRGADRAA